MQRKIIHQDDFDVHAVACSEGSPLEEHFHPAHDQYIWVMSGALRFRFLGEDEESQVLSPGSSVTIPRGTAHLVAPQVRSSLMVMYRPPSSGDIPDAEVLTSMIPDTP